jgi:N-acetylmuramoyl-L-alanine amidase
LKKVILIFLLILSVSVSSFALSKEFYQDKYNETKKEYLHAIMGNDRAKEIESLKKLIRYGKKLNTNTLKYQKELNRIDHTSVLQKPVTTTSYLKPKVKKTTQKYTIESVTQKNNSIIISFYRNINTSYIDFNEHREGKYYYDQFDIKGSFKDAAPTKLAMFGVDKITIYQKNTNTLRISLKNRSNLKTIYIVLGNKIIIKVLDSKTQKKTYVKKKEVQLLPNDIFRPSQKVIVVDAGHGGKDAGAIGVNKVYEKRVVYSISKFLMSELKKEGFKVYLTRTRDRFVELSDRTKYANKKNADLFISVHANAAHKSKRKTAHGIETYFLSPARSERAKRVAAKENKGDMNKMGWSSKNSLLTILNRSKITASNKAAIDIQKNMLYTLRENYGKKSIRDGGVREGPFWVLVGAQMPSVLIEVGYLTHPREGKRVATKKYQKLVAQGIAQGIKSYFLKN